MRNTEKIIHENISIEASVAHHVRCAKFFHNCYLVERNTHTAGGISMDPWRKNLPAGKVWLCCQNVPWPALPSGGFGAVYLGMSSNGKLVAIKVMEIAKENAEVPPPVFAVVQHYCCCCILDSFFFFEICNLHFFSQKSFWKLPPYSPRRQLVVTDDSNKSRKLPK